MRQWSEYQVNVFDEIKLMGHQTQGALMIEAVAGSGKTTTIVEALKLIDVRMRVLFLAFNKHIAEELKCRVPPNCEAATMNAFGYRAVRAAAPRIKMEQNKNRYAINSLVADKDKRRAWEGLMSRLIGLRKATVYYDEKGDKRLEEFNTLADRYDVDMPTSGDFASTLEQVWNIVLNDTSTVDFDDQWFHPVWYDLPVPQFDWVFVDEAQDLCTTQIELLSRIAPRVVAVGDPRQSIYGFRGADPTAMAKLKELNRAKVLPLSICYRCPSLVIEQANKVFAVNDETPDFILPAPDAADGVVDSIDIKVLRHEAKPGSWVLCRTTAPLVKECLKFIVEGVKATVKGRDIGQQLTRLVEKVAGDGAGAMDIARFTEFLESFYQSEKKRLEAAQRDQQAQALEDRVEAIHALAEGARVVDDIYRRIDTVFSDDPSPGVTFATAHRSKGLEADDVYILCPELMPFPKAKTEWAKQQELNLKYVAVTRAMKRLRWVTGTAKAAK